jgi:DNA-binding NtrC family response regulator
VTHSLVFAPQSPLRGDLLNSLRHELATAVLEAESCDQARQLLQQGGCALFFCQLGAEPRTSLQLLRQLDQLSPTTVSILLLPEQPALPLHEILRSGAHFYLSAPCDTTAIGQIIQRAHQHFRAQRVAECRVADAVDFPEIIGQSACMQRLFDLIRRLADDRDSTLLIQGESGTGKELVARAVHGHSPRRHGNFVPLNCAAIPEELLESELFGYEKGAFTGAFNNKRGRLQHADGGTLFLDEIGDMKPALQAKLLRVIQEKSFEPVGSVRSVNVDVRIVAATHRNLEEAVSRGAFREDLYYRLNVVPLQIPPLRQRSDDVPLLLETFTRRFCHSKNRPIFGYSPAALEHLKNYPWPGNVRELENLVQRLAILHGDSEVTPADLPEKYLDASPAYSDNGSAVADGGTDFNSRVSEFEDRLILQALIKTGGNKKEAAELLNLKRTTLLEKIKKKQLDKALGRIGGPAGS